MKLLTDTQGKVSSGDGSRRLCRILAAVGLVIASGALWAQETGDDATSGEMIVTRHFTGLWDQVDQESQGIALQVVEQLNGSRRAVAYWYTYGADRKTAWFIGIGDLVANRIEMELYDSTDVGFMQDADPNNDPVSDIGTLVLQFDSCQSGTVTYDTNREDIGSGSFHIERLAEVMNTHCTGSIVDDMHSDAIFGEQRLELRSSRQGIEGYGYARYEDHPGQMEFEVEVQGMPDGSYHLFVGGQDRGAFEVVDGYGRVRFISPGEDGYMLMNFDPRGMQIEVRDGQGAVLSSFGDTLDEDEHEHHMGMGSGDHYGHDYDCAYGFGEGMSGSHGGMDGMGGMRDCVEDGDYVGIQADLNNTAVLADATGEAEWEMNAERVRFAVEIEDVPVGFYSLHVAGEEVGVIETFEMHNGEIYGRISFRDPPLSGVSPLDFEPRGEKIEVFQGDDVILEVSFPTE
jgi:hypothetical protein